MPRSRDAELLHHIAGVLVRPVFITGPHRSGTTFLYSLLQSTGRFNVVTAYHVLRRDDFLADHVARRGEQARRELAEEFRSHGILDRVIDGVPVTPDSPEEYGFALGGGEPAPVGPENLTRFATFCRKVQFTGHPERVLLLKNPWDLANSLYLKRHFPEARFLYLHRHPIRTLNSQVRAARSMIAERNAYVAILAPRYGHLFRRPLTLAFARLLWGSRFAPSLLARGLIRQINRATQERRALPLEDRFDAQYERLCESPNEAIAGILRWLGLDSDSLPDFRGSVSPRGGKLLPEVERLRAKLAAGLRDYYEEFGYSESS